MKSRGALKGTMTRTLLPHHGHLVGTSKLEVSESQEGLWDGRHHVGGGSDLPTGLPRPWGIFGIGPRDDTECHRSHVSLFSGCGGFDLGFRQAGFRTVLANDIAPDACATYRNNLGDILEGDLTKVTLPKLRGRPDVLTAGFPCQPFSNAGSRRGVADHRGTLYETALSVVDKLKPRSLVFENVRGILSFRQGRKLLVEGICQELDRMGYDVVLSLLDASRHHVPQRRLRVFIVGVSRTRGLGRFAFPAPVFREDLTLRHTILDLARGSPQQDELMPLNPQALHIGGMVPEGGSWKDIPYDQLPERLQRVWDNIERYRWPNFYRRFHRDEVAGTITAAFKPENAGVWHPVRRRVLSVREIARIQTFPDWFRFEGRTIKSKYQQIGNAVPPRLAYELAIRLDEVLAGRDQRAGQSYLSFRQFERAGQPLRARDLDIVFSEGR